MNLEYWLVIANQNSRRYVFPTSCLLSTYEHLNDLKRKTATKILIQVRRTKLKYFVVQKYETRRDLISELEHI